jgi:hypothetical protein
MRSGLASEAASGCATLLETVGCVADVVVIALEVAGVKIPDGRDRITHVGSVERTQKRTGPTSAFSITRAGFGLVTRLGLRGWVGRERGPRGALPFQVCVTRTADPFRVPRPLRTMPAHEHRNPLFFK